jgi:hypothetical protein
MRYAWLPDDKDFSPQLPWGKVFLDGALRPHCVAVDIEAGFIDGYRLGLDGEPLIFNNGLKTVREFGEVRFMQHTPGNIRLRSPGLT